MLFADAGDNPVTADFDADEISPYRRRQKALPVRSRRFVRLRWSLRALLFTAFVLLPVAYAGYSVAVFLQTSPLFVLGSATDVAVEGNHFVSRGEVCSALGIFASSTGRRNRGVNIFRLSLEQAKRDVESIPWVRSAVVTRSYPHCLAVRVEERVPVAFVNADGRIKLIDGEGMLLERPEKASFNFPVLSGLDSAASGAERRMRLGLYQEFRQQAASEAAASGWMVSEVDLSDSDDLTAVVVRKDKSLELHLGHSDFGERFHNFLTLLPELDKTEAEVDSIDLRYRNQVVVHHLSSSSLKSGVQASRSGLKTWKE